jgi:hypothetical protein
MLAYVFWHTRDARVEDREYVARLLEFHQVFAKTRPAGYRRSVVARVRGAPWIADGGDAFEEWYLLEGSAALDVVNEAAVSGACLAPHDNVARLAAAGTAGLYRLRRGAGDEAAMRHAAWFAKPQGMRYAEMYAQLEPVVAKAGATLWGRQMVLGPTPEFCLRSKEALVLPATFTTTSLAPAPLWSSAMEG